MGRFRTFLESLNGEYWIEEDGRAQDAEGTGDYDHATYALFRLQKEIGETIGVKQKLLDAEYPNYTAIQRDAVRRYLSNLNQQQQMSLKQQLNVGNLFDAVDEVFVMAARAAGVNDEALEAANGRSDVREYAMKYWGWKRVVGNNVETWTLTPEDMRVIAQGIGDIDEELDDDTYLLIYVDSTGQHHEATLGALEQGRLMNAPVPQMQITPAQMQQATIQSVKNAEIEKLHPYYKDVSPRSQSFPIGDWRIWF